MGQLVKFKPRALRARQAQLDAWRSRTGAADLVLEAEATLLGTWRELFTATAAGDTSSEHLLLHDIESQAKTYGRAIQSAAMQRALVTLDIRAVNALLLALTNLY